MSIIEPLLVSSLFPWAVAIYDTRVTEYIILFHGHTQLGVQISEVVEYTVNRSAKLGGY